MEGGGAEPEPSEEDPAGRAAAVGGARAARRGAVDELFRVELEEVLTCDECAAELSVTQPVHAHDAAAAAAHAEGGGSDGGGGDGVSFGGAGLGCSVTAAAAVDLGLSCVVALCHRSPTSY
jgi:hypothetical protein